MRRKLSDYRMQLAITQSPHSKDPQMLWKELEHQENVLEGRSYLEAEFDQAGFDAFKQTLQRQGAGVSIK